jgi:hypothetical protein
MVEKPLDLIGEEPTNLKTDETISMHALFAPI